MTFENEQEKIEISSSESKKCEKLDLQGSIYNDFKNFKNKKIEKKDKEKKKKLKNLVQKKEKNEDFEED